LNLSFDTNLASQVKDPGVYGKINVSSGSSVNWGFTTTWTAAAFKEKKKKQKLD